MENEGLLVARRSIYNDKMKVVGYHLLFENLESLGVEGGSIPDGLSCDYLRALFADPNMKPLLGSGIVLVNFSLAMLTAAGNELAKTKLMVGINCKYTPMTPEVIAAAEKLKKSGFKIAVSGFKSLDEVKEIKGFAHTLIINMETDSAEQLPDVVNQLSADAVKIFVENVQTHESFELGKKLGCTYFEGYFLSLPNLDSKQKVTSNRITTMRLLVALDDPEITLDKVEELLSQDARLSYRLLRAVNSAAYGLPRVVNSLREAVVFLGLKQVRSWASVIVLTSLDDKPTDLMLTTMIRARMCELVAEIIGVEDTKPFFTAGLFSTLDAMLDKSMDVLVKELSLSAELSAALLQKEGDIGNVLLNVIAYGRGEWDELKDSGIGVDVWRRCYIDSVRWSTASFNEMVN